MDIIKELSELAFASRLKRLRDSLITDASKVYSSQNINFEPRWFAIFYLLKDNSPLAIGEIAASLGITQPAVSQLADIMLKKGLVAIHEDKSDTRRRLIGLTHKGKELVPKLQPVWDDIQKATKELFDSIDFDVMYIMSKIEDALLEKDMYTRIMEKSKERNKNEVQILEYKPKYRSFFRTLNYEWIKKYFEIEKADEKLLNDPESQIIKKGGEIYFAEINNEIIGTGALIKNNYDTFEMAKIAVTEKARGRQAGKKISEYIINRARERKAKKIFIETSPKLMAAYNLYKKLGFIQVPYEKGKVSEYKRMSIKMELKLN